jgi:hypothetical protein
MGDSHSHVSYARNRRKAAFPYRYVKVDVLRLSDGTLFAFHDR